MSIRSFVWTSLVLLLVGSTAIGATPPKKKKKNARPTDSERGTELYERHCVMCHGPAAKGDGPMTKALVADVPDLTGVLTKETMSTYVQTVLKGKNSMPGYELSFDKYDARRVLRTMIKLQTEGPVTETEEGKPSPDAPAPATEVAKPPSGGL